VTEPKPKRKKHASRDNAVAARARRYPLDVVAALKLEICRRISEGEYLSQILRSRPGLPVRAEIWNWLKDDASFRESYAAARELGFDALADEIIRIADTPEMLEELEYGADDKVLRKRISDATRHRQMRIHARMWVLARWAPHRYGDRVALTNQPGENLVVELATFRKAKPDAPTE
jgi:hypothetical protein